MTLLSSVPLLLPGVNDPQTTTHTWWVLSPEQRKSLADHAGKQTVAGLNSAVRVRSNETMRKDAMQSLTEQGFHECTTCCGPILDTDDPHYAKKDALIQQIGKQGSIISRCKCGKDHVS